MPPLGPVPAGERVTQRLARSALPLVAIVAFAIVVAATLWSAGSTIGYDFHAYDGAARRLLEGHRLYDPAIDVAGGFAIYLYPPPFALAIVPLSLIGGQAAVWVWTILLVAAFLVGIAILPVSPTVRWLVVLLGGIDWPFLYSIKLGQVGPILFLLFAIGWRWLDHPNRLGASIGLGTLVKVQPAVLVVWAALTGRWRAAAIAVAVVGGGAILATAVAGIQPWFDYPALLGRVSSPLTTPHNFTPGAIAYQAGLPVQAAGVIQLAALAGSVVAVVIAARTTDADASYLVAVVASQLLSPLLWDHYAMLLLLPVAWLLERRQWWAVLIPIATSIIVVGILPAAVYPLAFAICLLAPIALGWRRPEPGRTLVGSAA
jgi:alpha-1,2-mannosyltransferase